MVRMRNSHFVTTLAWSKLTDTSCPRWASSVTADFISFHSELCSSNSLGSSPLVMQNLYMLMLCSWTGLLVYCFCHDGPLWTFWKSSHAVATLELQYWPRAIHDMGQGQMAPTKKQLCAHMSLEMPWRLVTSLDLWEGGGPDYIFTTSLLLNCIFSPLLCRICKNTHTSPTYIYIYTYICVYTYVCIYNNNNNNNNNNNKSLYSAGFCMKCLYRAEHMTNDQLKSL